MYSEEVLSGVQDQWMEDIRNNPAFLMTNNPKPMAELSPPRLSHDEYDHRFSHLNAEYERFLSSIGAPNYAPEISPMKTKATTSRKSFGNQLEAENYSSINLSESEIASSLSRKQIIKSPTTTSRSSSVNEVTTISSKKSARLEAVISALRKSLAESLPSLSQTEATTIMSEKEATESTEPKASSSRNLESAEVNLNAMSIPKHEIECDIETFLVHHTKNFFSKTGTSLKSNYHKKFGFRQLIETKDTELYPSNPRNTTRQRTIADASNSSVASVKESEKSTDEESQLENPPKRIKLDSGSTQVTSKQVQKEVNIFEGEATFHIVFRANRLKELKNTNEKSKIDVSSAQLPAFPLMRRTFPSLTERTEKEQKKRDKNTAAASKSRAKNKIYAQNLEEEAFEAMKENFELKRKVAFLRAQVNSTLKKHGKKEVNFNELYESYLEKMMKKTASEVSEE
ncbi:CLUMA_CG007008, isoform A [Clunio marinus]|uniref:CLUMA_CG007008, isoform A n=1 Tax=Clunio marinus TaxID=568069 RepID=A0A1J1HZE3_9DIPT|nr:CLUMA_CG007008, isoform A [Clunio marinus]